MKRNESTQGQFVHCMLTWLVFGRIFWRNSLCIFNPTKMGANMNNFPFSFTTGWFIGIKTGKHSMCGSMVVFLVCLIFIRSFQLFCKWIQVNTRITWICAQKMCFFVFCSGFIGEPALIIFCSNHLKQFESRIIYQLRSVWVV